MKSTVKPTHAAAAGFLAGKQQDASRCVNDGRQVGPNGVFEDPFGSERFQWHTGQVIAVHELLEAEKQHGNGSKLKNSTGMAKKFRATPD